MEQRRFVTIDGNEAAANIAHLCNEVMAIYPITPSSGLGELTDAWAAAGTQKHLRHRAGSRGNAERGWRRAARSTVRCKLER